MSPEWFERIIVPQRSIVLNHALSILRTPSRATDAEDARATAELATWNKFTSHPDPLLTDPDAVRSYYWGCIKKAAISINRLHALHLRLRTKHHHDIVNNLQPDDIFTPETLRRINEIFEIAEDHLSAREIEILELRYGMGFSLKETAARLDITWDNVRQIHRRALSKLIILCNGTEPPDGPGGGSGARARSRTSKKSIDTRRTASPGRGNTTTKDTLKRNYREFVLLLKLYGRHCALRNGRIFTRKPKWMESESHIPLQTNVTLFTIDYYIDQFLHLHFYTADRSSDETVH